MTQFNYQYQQMQDDVPLVVVRRDASGGQNTRVHASQIPETQWEELLNIDITTPGKRRKRNGSVLIANDKGSDSVVKLHAYERQGYNDNLMMVEDTHLWANEAEAATWTSVKSDFTANEDVGIVSGKESGITPDNVIFVNVGDSNWFRFHKDSGGSWDEQDLGSTSGTGSDSPPASTVGAWHGARFWVLQKGHLYFSDAYDTDYSSAFDTTTNFFRMPIGTERGLASTRDMGLVVMGSEQIWGIAPSATPAATDKPEPLVTNLGVVSKKAWCYGGDDIYFFSNDGFRSLKRTVQDKLQVGSSFPLSYTLKEEFENIDWSLINRLCMEYFDNKIFISVPTGATTFRIWVYYPATQAWTVISGWSPRCWAKYKVSGEQRLYYGKHGDGVVYRAWYGNTDEGTTTSNGTAINYEEISRNEDMGQPLLYKKGGEIEVKAESAGDYDLAVSAEFDENGYNLIGTLNLAGGLVTFPTTFPVTFGDNVIYGKYHIDEYERWRTCQVKISHNATNSTDDIAVLEHSIVTYPEKLHNE